MNVKEITRQARTLGEQGKIDANAACELLSELLSQIENFRRFVDLERFNEQLETGEMFDVFRNLLTNTISENGRMWRAYFEDTPQEVLMELNRGAIEMMWAAIVVLDDGVEYRKLLRKMQNLCERKRVNQETILDSRFESEELWTDLIVDLVRRGDWQKAEELRCSWDWYKPEEYLPEIGRAIRAKVNRGEDVKHTERIFQLVRNDYSSIRVAGMTARKQHQDNWDFSIVTQDMWDSIKTDRFCLIGSLEAIDRLSYVWVSSMKELVESACNLHRDQCPVEVKMVEDAVKNKLQMRGLLSRKVIEDEIDMRFRNSVRYDEYELYVNHLLFIDEVWPIEEMIKSAVADLDPRNAAGVMHDLYVYLTNANDCGIGATATREKLLKQCDDVYRVVAEKADLVARMEFILLTLPKDRGMLANRLLLEIAEMPVDPNIGIPYTDGLRERLEYLEIMARKSRFSRLAMNLYQNGYGDEWRMVAGRMAVYGLRTSIEELRLLPECILREMAFSIQAGTLDSDQSLGLKKKLFFLGIEESKSAKRTEEDRSDLAKLRSRVKDAPNTKVDKDIKELMVKIGERAEAGLRYREAIAAYCLVVKFRPDLLEAFPWI